MGYKKKDIKYYLHQFCRYTNEGKNIIRETKLGVLKNNLEYVKEYANKQGIDIKELCNRYGYYFVEKGIKARAAAILYKCSDDNKVLMENFRNTREYNKLKQLCYRMKISIPEFIKNEGYTEMNIAIDILQKYADDNNVIDWTNFVNTKDYFRFNYHVKKYGNIKPIEYAKENNFIPVKQSNKKTNVISFR